MKRKRGGNKLCICSHFGVTNIRDNRNQHVFFAQMTPCTIHYDIIYHPFPINSQYFEDVGGWQPSSPREKWHISSCYLPLQSTAGEIFLQYCRLSVTQWQQLLNVYPLYYYTCCYCFKNWCLKWELLHAYNPGQNVLGHLRKLGTKMHFAKLTHILPLKKAWGCCYKGLFLLSPSPPSSVDCVELKLECITSTLHPGGRGEGRCLNLTSSCYCVSVPRVLTRVVGGGSAYTSGAQFWKGG